MSAERQTTDPQPTVAGPAAPLSLPVTLRRQLDDFRATVRRVKGLEAICIALFGVLVAWIALFFLDRLTDTSVVVRFGLNACAIAASQSTRERACSPVLPTSSTTPRS